MRKKQSVTLYNILFPIWMLVWIPSPLWLLLIPLNFIIDYLVLYKSLPPMCSGAKTFRAASRGKRFAIHMLGKSAPQALLQILSAACFCSLRL